MKKIIYSLVIMIAAGSLFTSCVENTEPQGIRDLREAKADYLASLSKLREADAELVKAQAAYQSAQIAVVEADAALKQALANIAQALADAAQIGVEYLDAELQMKLEADKAEAEIAAVEAQKDLAIAQADLETALRKIAAESIGLTEDEKAAIGNKAFALKTAQDKYHTAFVDVENAKKAIWEKEYLHDSTDFEYLNINGGGGYSWRPQTDYNHLITLREEAIADAEDQIASDEALLEDHTAVKDSLDAMKAKVKDLEREKLIAEQKLNIYEAGEFNEAKDAYKKAVETFKKDSVDIYPFVSFDFRIEDEDENMVAREYSLTDGKFLDEKFVAYLNTRWLEGSDEQYHFYVLTSPADNGYCGEEDVIKVGSRPNGTAATQSDLKEAIALVDRIVDGLNRELVVINNINDSSTIEDAKVAAHKADSTFDADYAILKAGYEKSSFAKKITDSLAKLAADTVAEKTKYTAAAAELKAKETAAKTDSAAQIAAVRTAAAAYEKAVKDFAAAVAAFNNVKKVGAADSTNFINAIKAFGAAQAAFNGKEDSLSYKMHDPYTGDPTTSKDAFSAVNPNFFKNEEGHPVYIEKFVDVVTKVFGDGATFDTPKETLIAGATNPLKAKTSAADSIAVLKDKNLAVKAAVAAYVAAVNAKDLAKAANDSLKVVFDTKVDKYNTYKGASEGEAKAEYAKIFNKFWGKVGYVLTDEDYKPYPFTWTKKTFLDPENCVVFNYSDPTNPWIIKNPTLDAVLDGVAPIAGDSWNNYLYTGLEIFFGYWVDGNHKLTEFADAILKAQQVVDRGEYNSNKARLEKINAVVAQIKEEFEAEVAAVKKANEDHDAAWTRLTGKKNGNYQPDLYRSLVDQDKGVWKLGGKQLELANQFAPEYPEYVAEWKFAITVIQEKIIRANRYIDVLKYCYEQQVAFETGDPQYSLEYLISTLKDDIEDQNNVIESAKRDISAYKYAIAQIEAGYDPYSIELKVLYDELDKCEKALAVAEEELARAQKEYDEVIAKYGVNE